MLGQSASIPAPLVLSTHYWNDPNTGQGTTTNNYSFGDLSGADYAIIAIYNQSGTHFMGGDGVSNGWEVLNNPTNQRLLIIGKANPGSSDFSAIQGSNALYTSAVGLRLSGTGIAVATHSTVNSTGSFGAPDPPNSSTVAARNYLVIAVGGKGSSAGNSNSITSAPSGFSNFVARTATVAAPSNGYSCTGIAAAEALDVTSYNPGTFGSTGSFNIAAATLLLYQTG
jgi:hypothetical protein